MQPLSASNELGPRWSDGRPLAEVVAEFIKPNPRLTAVEQLQIYSRNYWGPLIDCVYEDTPGLRALLGEEKSSALVRAYLAKYPTRSFTLRNRSARLAQFTRETPRLTAPDTALAHAIARFEWAQTVAFDGEARAILTAADLADAPPAKLRLGLQPYLSLLALDWPVNDYVLAVKQREALRAEASNTIDHGRARRPAQECAGRAEKKRSSSPTATTSNFTTNASMRPRLKSLPRSLPAARSGRPSPERVATSSLG